MKQLEIFESLLQELKKDKSVKGVLLTGSVANNTATIYSDLDIVVLCNKDCFVSKIIQNVTVEITYITKEVAINKFYTHPISIYRYLDAKIEYDNGELLQIICKAKDAFFNYTVSTKERESLIYWLKSTKAKLLSALHLDDKIQQSYFVSTNSWKVLEGVWAVNEKPMPPSSSTYRRVYDLEKQPNDTWFVDLFSFNCSNQCKTMCFVIDWILTQL